MSVPFLDLHRQHAAIGAEIEAAVSRVLGSHRFILGPEVERLEEEIAAVCGTAHGVGVASGTDALMLALSATGVAPGDAVVTSPFSFFATASSIARLGARPVFADINPCTGDPMTVTVKRTADGYASNWLCDHAHAGMKIHVSSRCARRRSSPARRAIRLARGSHLSVTSGSTTR